MFVIRKKKKLIELSLLEISHCKKMADLLKPFENQDKILTNLYINYITAIKIFEEQVKRIENDVLILQTKLN